MARRNGSGGRRRTSNDMRDRMRQRMRSATRNTVEGKSGANWMVLPSDFNANEQFFEHKKGTNVVTILPYEVSIKNHPKDVQVGDLWYERTVSVHYNVGAGNKSVICPRDYGKKCPICEHAGSLWDEGETEEARPLWPKKRQIFNVLVDGEVMLWTLSFHLFGKILEQEIFYDDEQTFDLFYLLEKEDGYDVKIRFVEQTLGKNKFLEASKVDFKERRRDLDEALYDQVFDLDTLVECPDYETIRALFYEEDPEDNKEPERNERRGRREERDERPSRRSNRREERDNRDDDRNNDRGSRRSNKRNDRDDDRDSRRSSRRNDRDDDRDEKRSSRRNERRPSRRSNKDSECPHGHVFGDDCDNKDECDDCEVWEECVKVQERNR